jgi:hypothetical protein
VACEEPLEVRRLWTVRVPARIVVILRLCAVVAEARQQSLMVMW